MRNRRSRDTYTHTGIYSVHSGRDGYFMAPLREIRWTS